MIKEKREFLIRVIIKLSDGRVENLERYVELEINWSEKNHGILAKESETIAFGEPNYNFCLTNLEVERNWKKDFFKDHVTNWKLELIRDKRSEKIITYWGTRVDPTQYRARGFLIVGTAFLLLVGSILAWFLWKKKN